MPARLGIRLVRLFLVFGRLTCRAVLRFRLSYLAGLYLRLFNNPVTNARIAQEEPDDLAHGNVLDLSDPL